jgi:hypothetical protein
LLPLAKADQMQHALPIKPPMNDVDPGLIDRQPTFTAALRLCQTHAGLENKAFVGFGGIVKREEDWSRIFSGARFFPQDHLPTFMDLCENEAPLHWLARRRGYNLVPMESEMERRLRVERERAERAEQENSLLKRLLVGKAT